MARELYGFFDSTGEDTREYYADQMAAMFRLLSTDGVRAFGTNLQVIPDGDNMLVRVLSGAALIRGYMYELDNEDGGAIKTLTHAAAGVLPRIDRVVVRLNLATGARLLQLAIIQGAQAAEPEAPALTRSVDTGIFEISLARVKVNGAATAITTGDITDERGDASLCGATTPYTLTKALLKDSHGHDLATTLLPGFLGAADKQKLDSYLTQDVRPAAAPSFAGATFTGDVNMGGKKILNAVFE